MPSREIATFIEASRAAAALSREDRSPELESYLYTPDRRLPRYISTLKAMLTPGSSATDQVRGQVLEQIAFLAFSGFPAHGTFKAYQSAGPQHDLLVKGRSGEWDAIWKMLDLPNDGRNGFLIECKATATPVSDAEFARLCSNLELSVRAKVGVFFSVKGGSGFPRRGKPRARGVQNAKLRQMLFYAHRGIPVVVFDLDDIELLTKPGTLIRLLEEKVDDAVEARGLPAADPFSPVCDLPPHLSRL